MKQVKQTPSSSEVWIVVGINRSEKSLALGYHGNLNEIPLFQAIITIVIVISFYHVQIPRLLHSGGYITDTG